MKVDSARPIGLAISRPLLSFAALASACRSGDDVSIIDPGLPTDAAFVALQLEGPEHEPLGTSGLLQLDFPGAGRVDVDAALAPALERAARVRLAAFSHAQLGRWMPMAEETMRQPLAPASARDPLLPKPMWSSAGERVGDRVDLESSAEALELTAPWLDPCPRRLRAQPGDPVEVDLRCAFVPCPISAWQKGCEVQIDASKCGFGAIEGVLDGRGRLELQRLGSTFSTCHEVEAREGASLALSCEDENGACPIEVLEPPFPVLLSADSVEVVPGATPMLGGTDHEPPHGYIAGLAVLDDRIAVATFAGAFNGWNRCDPAEGGESRVVLVDPDRLSVIEEVTAPGCLMHLQRDPLGPGFLGVFGPVGGVAQVGRFDSRGRLTAQAAAPRPDGALGRISAMITSPSSGTLLLAWAWPFDMAQAAGAIAVHALSDLSRVSEAMLPGRDAQSMAELGDGSIGVLEDGEDRLFLIDPRTGAEIRRMSLYRFNSAIAAGLGVLGWHSPTNTAIVSTENNGAAMWTFSLEEPERTYRRVRFHAWPAAPYNFHGWPSDPRFLLVSATAVADSKDTAVALFEPSVPRFLPGPVVVGRGRVGHMAADAQNRVWLTLTATGRLARVTPR